MKKNIWFLGSAFLIIFYIFFGTFNFNKVSNTVHASAPSNGLVGYWSLDEGSGSTANDTSGSGNTGSITSGVWATGKVNAGLQFNGSTSSVIAGNSGAVNPANQLTLIAWINPSNVAAGASQDIIAKEGPTNPQYSLNLQATNAGKLRFTVKAGGVATNLNANTTFSNNTWYLVAGTYDGSTMNIFINGSLDSSVSKTGTMADNGVAVALGNRATGSAIPFGGIIDEARIYNRALSAQEILDIYSSESGGTGAPLPPADTTAPVISSISTSNLTTTSVTINWTTNESSNSQVDYGVTSAFGSSTGIDSTMTTSHSVSLSNLSPSTLYHFRVKSSDASSNLGQSTEQTFTTNSSAPVGDTTAPTTPTNLTATAASSSQINLSWSASTDNVGVTGYHILRGGSQIGNSTGTTYQDTGLSASTAYTYTITAYDAANNTSTASTQAGATTNAATTTPPPSNNGTWSALPWPVSDRIRDSIVAPNNDIFVGTKTSGVYRSTNGGQTWTAVNTGLMIPGDYHSFSLSRQGNVLVSLDYINNAGSGDRLYKFNGSSWTLSQGASAGQWIGGTALDASGNVIAGGVWGGPIYKSTDDANTFTQVGSVGDAAFTVYGDPSGNIYVGTEGFGVLKSTNSGSTFVSLGRPTGGMILGSGGNIHDILMTKNGSLIAASMSNVTKWVSGTTWVQASGIPAFTNARGLVQAPDGKIYAATDLGVYVSSDDANTFTAFNSGLPAPTSPGNIYGGSRLHFDSFGNLYLSTDTGMYVLSSASTPPTNDTTAPTVSITAPASAATVSSTINLTATASDNVGVTSVQFQIDGSNTGSVVGGSSPYSLSWNSTAVVNGSHTIGVVVKDAANNTTIKTVAVTVSNTVVPPVNGNPANPADTLTIKEKSGATQSNYPVQIARPFAQGEIANFPQVIIGGQAIQTQADVKARWSDGSVKHAILSFLVSSLPANGTVTVSFQNQTSGNNTPLTQSQMLASNFNFDAQMQLSGIGNASARTMLSNGDYTYWASGPVATTIILSDNSSTRKYDIGPDSNRSFRPIFEATFWPTINKVYVRYVGENTNTQTLENLSYNLTLTAGQTSPSTVYSLAGFTQIFASRWTRTAWINGAPSVVDINHNLAYLEATYALPNYDMSKAPSAGSPYTLPDIGTVGGWTQAMGTTGGRPDIGPYPDWTVKWLYTGDHNLKDQAFGNADLAGAWPMNFREGDATKFYDTAHSVPAIGKPISIKARPSLFLSDGNGFINYIYTNAADKIVPAGTISSNGWSPDSSHQPDTFYPQYLLSGDKFYLEGMQFWSAWNGFNANPGNLYYGKPAGMNTFYGSGQVRAQAWQLRSLAELAFINPDSTPEKSYYNTMMDEGIAIFDGARGLTNSQYVGTTAYQWGATVGKGIFNNNTPSPLHFWDEANTGLNEPPLDITKSGSGTSPWMENFVYYALGRAKELGFATGPVLSWAATKDIGQLTDPNYNPYLIGLYREPVTDKSGNYLTTWAAVKNAFLASEVTQAQTTFTNQLGDTTHGYPYIALAGISMMANEPGGAQAWNWISSQVLNNSALNSNPKWAILPRSVSNVPPPVIPPVIPPTPQAPVISNLVGSNTTTTSTQLSWTTDILSDTQVDYGLSTSYTASSTLTNTNPMVTSHLVTLNGLTPNTLYHFRVKSKEATGLLSTSADFTFTTPAVIVITPTAPVISSFIATPSSINSGQSTTLSFVVTGSPITLTINNNVGSVLNQTSKIVSPTLTTVYTLTATNTGGTATAQTTVTVGTSTPPINSTQPTVASFIANPSSVVPGAASTLSWIVTGSPVPTITINNGIGDVTNVTQKVVNPSQSTTYTLTAVNSAGTATGQAMVSLVNIPVVNPPSPASSGGGGGGGGGNNNTSVTYIPSLGKNTSSTPTVSPNPSCTGNCQNVTTNPTSTPGGEIKNAYNFGAVTLRNGSRGDGVKELQRFLNQVLNLGLVVDGKLGPKTITVIKKWQKDHKLVPDGLVGPKTKAIMNSSISN